MVNNDIWRIQCRTKINFDFAWGLTWPTVARMNAWVEQNWRISQGIPQNRWSWHSAFGMKDFTTTFRTTKVGLGFRFLNSKYGINFAVSSIKNLLIINFLHAFRQIRYSKVIQLIIQKYSVRFFNFYGVFETKKFLMALGWRIFSGYLRLIGIMFQWHIIGTLEFWFQFINLLR